MPVNRRRREDDDTTEDERPTRGRRRDEDDEDRPSRGSRRSSRDRDEDDEPPARGRSRSRSRDDDDDEADKPSRGRSRSRSRDDDEDDKPSRSRGSSRDEGKSRSRGTSTGGWSSYSQKRRSGGNFADEFKPADYKDPVLIKFLDAEPFDVFLQHWIDDMPKGERKSYVCYDDEYFKDFQKGCPLCDLGEKVSSFSLFNVLNLDNPRKPEVQVWRAPVTVTDQIQRMAENKRTSPVDREDLYFEIDVVKSKNRYTYNIQVVKAEDVEQDFEFEPFTEDELAEFDKDKFEDRTAVTQVDSYDDLVEIANGLD